MSDARHALLTAIYGTLTSDTTLLSLLGEGGVYDPVPRGAAYPYVSFGDCLTRVADGDEPASEAHRFEIEVHSRTPGRRQVSEITARVGLLIHGADLPVTGFSLVFVTLRTTTITPSRDGRSYRARLRFDALTETL
ncbi:MAG: DUF3168 domain-containing protein [Pseudomonadota bacterium]